MRKDLNKQLCERERYFSDDHYSNYRHAKTFKQDDYCVDASNDEQFDSRETIAGGRRESMKARYRTGWMSKQFNENLNPLWGIVRKNVGRKWDDVYSELCEVFDKRSVINQHILDHLFQYVETKAFIAADGRLWSPGGWGKPVPLSSSRYDYYVDPLTGILRSTNHPTYRQGERERVLKRKQEQLKTCRVINDTTELHCIENVWYEITFERCVGKNQIRWRDPTTYTKASMYNTTVYPVKYDVLLKTDVSANRVAVSKRQLSHKEKKKYNLV